MASLEAQETLITNYFSQTVNFTGLSKSTSPGATAKSCLYVGFISNFQLIPATSSSDQMSGVLRGVIPLKDDALL